MIGSYNPYDWYWIVGGDGPHIDTPGGELSDPSRVYSSVRDKYLPNNDPTYTAWVESEMESNGGYDPTTRIDTQENLKVVLQAFGLDPQFTP